MKNISARVARARSREVVAKGPYQLRVGVSPNRAALPNTFSVAITRGGRPVRGAQVVSRFDMLDMDMGEQSYRVPERKPGVFVKSAPALVMVGHWALQFEVTPPGSEAVRRHPPRQGLRMSVRTRLLLALVALAAAAVAWFVVLDAIRRTI